MKVLLIIDMQVGLFKTETSRFDTNGVIARINQLSNAFRRNGDQIIFIQHNGNKDDSLEPGTADWEILPDLNRETTDLCISKTACDSSFETELSKILKKLNISEVIIIGCATDFCVDTTVRSAASKKYEVVVVGDGHTTADRPNIDAETVINHHNWVWGNFIVPNRRIEVITSDQLLRELKNDFTTTRNLI